MDQDDEHEALKQLFERTAERPSGPTLTKLAARALDVPARAARVPRFLPSWAWSPTFAGVSLAVAAAVALVLALPASAPTERTVASVSASPASATGAEPTASSVVKSQVPASAPLLADVADGEGDFGLGLDDSSEASSFNVSGPESDQDLDAWLAASKALADGS